MARRYARSGDDVVWFNSSFYHARKMHRFSETVVRQVEPRLTIVGLYGDAYRKNVSLRRLRHNRQVAAQFRKQLGAFPKPDVIVASMPLPELASEATKFARTHGIPVVVDIRDFWPDIWLEAMPAALRPLGRVALWPYYRMLRNAIDGATGVSGLSEPCVEWGLGLGTRARTIFDKPLPLAYEAPDLSAEAIAEASAFWDATGVPENRDALTLCYFGNISRRYEFDTIFDAVKLLPENVRSRIRIVLCGVGERYDELKVLAERSGTIVMPGWMDAAQIETLKQRSQIGLLPYPSSQDYTKSMPNKVFDYFVGGLPILTSLQGVTGDLIRAKGCGWLYGNRDPDSLARLLKRLVDDKQAIAEAARQSVEVAHVYSADAVYGEFHDRLEAMLRTARRPD